jgi:hypothetical protein
VEQERADYDDGAPAAGTWYGRERWSVLLPGILIGSVLAGAWCAIEVPGPLRHRVAACAVVLAGPFAGFPYGGPSCLCPIAVLALPAMLAHPLRPRPWAGFVTAAGLALWFFAGWAELIVLLYAG